jgi:TetR/AcrR family transcriptional repressor of mexAB-oprM operon
MARRTKEDAEKTREALLNAAERVFLRRGVAKASLEEIGKEAGVTRGAVYWHFENKFAIFTAMHDRVKLPMDQMFQQLTTGDDPLKGLKEMCVHVFRTLEQDEHTRNVFTIMRLRCEDSHCSESEYGQQLARKRQDAHDKFNRVFTQIHKQHPLAPKVTPAFAAQAMHSFISGVFWDYLTNPAEYKLAKNAPMLVECFFRGILAPKA